MYVFWLLYRYIYITIIQIMNSNYCICFMQNDLYLALSTFINSFLCQWTDDGQPKIQWCKRSCGSQLRVAIWTLLLPFVLQQTIQIQIHYRKRLPPMISNQTRTSKMKTPVSAAQSSCFLFHYLSDIASIYHFLGNKYWPRWNNGVVLLKQWILNFLYVPEDWLEYDR